MYNLILINHPNFSYKKNSPTFASIHAPATPPYVQNKKGAHVSPAAPKKLNLELMMENFIMTKSQ